jgi:hypothetical protein
MATPLPPLEKIDAADAWQPWRPSADDPWTRKWAAHLFRRAAFGASREELNEAEKLGFDGTLDLLLHGRAQAEDVLTLTDVGGFAAAHDDGGGQLRAWWLGGMLHGGHPLREKLTLFWHNHFATSIVKVRDAKLMFRQNCLLREHALGKFGPLLQAISRDGAMLVWLDSNSNVKGKPNENYARELMELFSLGVGNYTEKDIREAARAFTGWHTDGHKFRFNPAAHDTGPKAVLGKTGNWDGNDVVKIVLEQPAAARFLVRKLYQFFVSETPPPDALLEPLSESFRKSDYDVAGLVKTVLASRLFYSDHAFRKRIKSPVEYALGVVQAVYRRYEERDPDYQPLPLQALVPWLTGMGQALFAPPNVKGWPGGRTWLNTATVLERDNFAAAMATGSLWTHPSATPTTPGAFAAFATAGTARPSARPPARGETFKEPEPPKALDPARLLEEEGVSQPEDVVRALLDLYVPGGVRAEAQTKLVAFVAEGKPTGAVLNRRVREAVHAILTMPEYQLA